MKFSVYINNELFYDTSFPFTDLGIISPVLTVEDSSAGSFEFTMPKGHAYYNTLERLKTKLVIFRNDEELPYWEGRVLSESTDFYNQRNVYCEGALSYLNDTHQPQHEYKAMTANQITEAILTIHNSKVDNSRKIYLGSVPTVWDDENNEYFYTQYESTLSSITKLADRFKYHIRIRHGYKDGVIVKFLDMFKEIQQDSLQQIIFGENLLDFTRNYDMSNLVTALLPLGNAGSAGSNHQLGNLIETFNETNYGWCFYIGEDTQGISYLATANVYPNVDNPSPLPSSIMTKKLVVQPGSKYYLTSTLPSGYEMLYYVLVYADGTTTPSYHFTDAKSTGSGGGDETITETLIEIPTGDNPPTQLWISGDTAHGSFKLYECKVLPDEFEDYITIESVNDGSMYIQAESRDITVYDEDGNPQTVSFDPVTEYGYYEKSLIIDIPSSKTESMEMAATYVKEQAKKYLAEYQFDNLSLEVSAVDMNALGVNIKYIDIYTKIRVISAIHGLNSIFPVYKARYAFDNLAETQYDLGSKDERELTAVNDAIDSELLAKIAEAPSTSSVLEAARNQAALILNGASEGYVTMIQSEDKTHTTAMVISGIPWDQHPTTYWMFNKDGWVHVNEGIPQTAADMNGHIYANLITAGTMYADRIKGGQLTLGNYGDLSANGSIRVRDAQDNTLLSVDTAGLTSRTTAVNNTCNIADGQVRFYRDNIETASFNGNTTYDLGTDIYGCEINSGILVLNSNTLWLTESRDSPQLWQGMDETITINNTTYTFHHGLLVQAVQRQEPEEEE